MKSQEYHVVNLNFQGFVLVTQSKQDEIGSNEHTLKKQHKFENLVQ